MVEKVENIFAAKKRIEENKRIEEKKRRAATSWDELTKALINIDPADLELLVSSMNEIGPKIRKIKNLRCSPDSLNKMRDQVSGMTVEEVIEELKISNELEIDGKPAYFRALIEKLPMSY